MDGINVLIIDKDESTSLTFSRHSWPMAFGSTCTSRMTELAWLTRHHIFALTFSPFPRWPLNSRINPSPTIPSREGTEDPTKHFYTRRARYLKQWQQSFGRIRGWSATGRARWYLLCHNKSFKKQVRAQLSMRRARVRLHAISATCSLLYRRTNTSHQLPFLGAEWHTHWHRSSLSRLSSRNRIAILAALYRVALAPSG